MQKENHVVDRRETEMSKQYLKEFLGAMIGYVIILLLALFLLDRVENTILRGLVVAAPVLPLLFALRAYLRHLGRLDELQQRIQLHAVGFAAGATGLIAFTLGMLEYAGLPRISMVWVLPMMVALWGIAQIWSARRYA